MKRIIGIIMVTILFFCGCNSVKASSRRENTSKAMVNSNIPFSIRSQLSYIIKSSDIEAIYGKADAVRNLDNYFYEIRNKNDGSKLFVIYTSQDNALYDIWHISKIYSEKDFSKLNKGKSTSDDVKKIDPYSYIFGISNNEAISEHKLKNNKVAIIQYIKKNSSWIVDDIKYKDDPSRFLSIISSSDLAGL